MANELYQKVNTYSSTPIAAGITVVCGAIVIGAGIYGYAHKEFNDNYFAHAMVLGSLFLGTGAGVFVGRISAFEQFERAKDAEQKLSQLEQKVSNPLK